MLYELEKEVNICHFFFKAAQKLCLLMLVILCILINEPLQDVISDTASGGEHL